MATTLLTFFPSYPSSPPKLITTTPVLPQQITLYSKSKKMSAFTTLCSYEVGGGYTDANMNPQKQKQKDESNPEYEAILRGGDQVTSVLQEMITLSLMNLRSQVRCQAYGLKGPMHYSLFTTTPVLPQQITLYSKSKKMSAFTTLCSYEVGGGYTDANMNPQKQKQKDESNPEYEAILRGGDQVTSVLQEMITLLEDMKMDQESEEVAVQIAAQGVIGKRVDEMESGFMMALDYMIEIAEKDQDDQRKSLLEVIKETVLSHLTKKCPPHVQVIGLLCRTPQKESRHELLRRVAAGGGEFKGENDTKVHLPGANLLDIANQADDLLETMETRPVVPDRKLLARLVLIREEARNMMGGGILDERNDRGFTTLPESEVNFLTKLVALKPGKTVQEMIKNVMLGKDEGKDNTDEESGTDRPRGVTGRESMTGRKPRPVRPGMFLETVSKVLGEIYSGNDSGITAQHLEWVHQRTLHILQEIAF